ncbi:MAG: hypothetical protein ACOYXN_01665 [Acidobacteriota bacterium]
MRQERTQLPGEGTSARDWGLAVFLLLAVWLYFFAPVFVFRLNYMGFHVLPDPTLLGLPAEQRAPTAITRFPNQDASLLWIHWPAYHFLAQEFNKGRFPLWNPSVGCGTPAVADPQSKPYDVFMAPFFYSPSANTFWIGVSLKALAGLLGLFLFFRYAGGRPVLAAAWACLSAFNPWTLQAMYLSNGWADWFLGWGLFLAHRAARSGPPHAWWPALGCAFAVFSGHPEEALLVSGITALAYACFLLETGLRIPSVLVRLGLFSLFLGGLTAVHTFPFLAELTRWDSYKVFWKGIGGLFYADLFNPRSTAWVHPILWGLAFAAVERRTRGWVAGALLLLTGGFVQFQGGPLDMVRAAGALGGQMVARYAQILFWAGLLWLSFQGARLMIASQASERFRNVRAIAYGLLLYFGGSWAFYVNGSIFWPALFPPLHYLIAAQSALLLGGLALAPRGAFLRIVSLTSLAAIPLVVPFTPHSFLSPLEPSVDPPTSVAYLAKHVPDHGRFSGATFEGTRFNAPLSPNLAPVWDLTDLRSNGPYRTPALFNLNLEWDKSEPSCTVLAFNRPSADFLRWVSVSHLAVPHGTPLRRGFFLAQSGEPLDVWGVESPLPRARILMDWVNVESLDQAGAFFRRSLLDGSSDKRVAVEGGPPPPPARGDSAPFLTWLLDEPDRLLFQARTEGDSLLVLSDAYHPGWRVWIDGVPSEILRCNGVFRAVQLPPGAHEVLFRFESPAHRAGVWTALLTLLIGTSLLAVRRLLSSSGGGRGAA